MLKSKLSKIFGLAMVGTMMMGTVAFAGPMVGDVQETSMVLGMSDTAQKSSSADVKVKFESLPVISLSLNTKEIDFGKKNLLKEELSSSTVKATVESNVGYKLTAYSSKITDKKMQDLKDVLKVCVDSERDYRTLSQDSTPSAQTVLADKEEAGKKAFDIKITPANKSLVAPGEYSASIKFIANATE